MTRCNADLSNSFGNLVQRVLSFIVKNCDACLPTIKPQAAADLLLSEQVKSRVTAMRTAMAALELQTALTEWMTAVFECNRYVDEQAPWALRKTDPARMVEVLATLCEAIRLLAIAIQPIVPRGAAVVLDALGIATDARDFAALDSVPTAWQIGAPRPAFPRLELVA
mgnify:CR=1 FL=1